MPSVTRPLMAYNPKMAYLLLSSQRGFSLVEVLVALMTAMIFVTVTMQMFVSAAFLRSKGDQYDQAYNWIQEDHEKVFAMANQYEASAVPASALCGATNPANGLAASFISDATLGLGGQTAVIGTRTFGGNSFTLTRTADYALSADPYKLLEINYTVTPASGGAAVAQINTEVAIYAGFKCL